ncbi:MAG TPA: kelch repeat-containing protein, partial [Haliangiales bacterium]|nr:kelch repeat-containing protein [Haliangiales bacterium]
SSELYDPATGTWTASGALTTLRTTQTATLLSNGKVLAAGGHVSAAGSTSTCELYDPATGTWTATGAMATARGNHTATLLLNGKVLVVGGHNRNTASAVATAELYDPATGTWTVTGAMASAREFHTATLLFNGKVLVAGGAPDAAQFTSLSNTEVYDPTTGVWTATGLMLSARKRVSS